MTVTFTTFELVGDSLGSFVGGGNLKKFMVDESITDYSALRNSLTEKRKVSTKIHS